MFAITTKTVPPCDWEGKRVSVRNGLGYVATYAWNYAVDVPTNHAEAVESVLVGTQTLVGSAPLDGGQSTFVHLITEGE